MGFVDHYGRGIGGSGRLDQGCIAGDFLCAQYDRGIIGHLPGDQNAPSFGQIRQGFGFRQGVFAEPARDQTGNHFPGAVQISLSQFR